MKKIHLYAVALLLTLWGCGTAETQTQTQTPAQIEQTAPEVAEAESVYESAEFQNLKGETVRLSDYKGKRILLNFWATWCMPCLMEMPSLAAAAKTLETENYAFLLVSNEPTETIKGFERRTNYGFKLFKAPDDFSPFAVQVLPTTYVFDTKGELALEFKGQAEWNGEEVLEQLRAVK